MKNTSCDTYTYKFILIYPNITKSRESSNNRGRDLSSRVLSFYNLFRDNEKKKKRRRLISVGRRRVTYFVFTTSYLDSGKIWRRRRRFWFRNRGVCGWILRGDVTFPWLFGLSELHPLGYNSIRDLNLNDNYFYINFISRIFHSRESEFDNEGRCSSSR